MAFRRSGVRTPSAPPAFLVRPQRSGDRRLPRRRVRGGPAALQTKEKGWLTSSSHPLTHASNSYPNRARSKIFSALNVPTARVKLICARARRQRSFRILQQFDFNFSFRAIALRSSSGSESWNRPIAEARKGRALGG